MNYLFVYGTLLRGEKNHHYLHDAVLVYQQAWVKGALFDTGRGYPVMKREENKRIYGEIYQVTEEQLQKINQLEEYKENASDNLYERITVSVWNDKSEKVDALTFITGAELAQSNKETPFGDWKVYHYLKRESIYYFAYGSCMDDERFRLANVEQYFSAITGKGLLHDHGFRFTRNSADGGKADIIESREEVVEGAVYKVPLEAIDYLYEREGVYKQAYRPAVVLLELPQGEKVEALTFIGIEKSKETKPTEHYATEIIRGGTGLLSDDYINSLKTHIDRLMN
ncbi:gamma-glutamylcyclotransferase [Lentibacillus sediminis]|uniref:gamma-glutamylcyclotransferase n=1 Tax=Lentibacillus sediminis TaxID=1940529 RepID=UPI0013043FD5|nr:gamma-glutamylcyclotransferase family protein [Lentibacillus sediminis]